MFIESTPVSPWQSNCYVLGLSDTGSCLIIDPGPGSYKAVTPLLEKKHLEPVGILMTHGHFDHVWDLGRFVARWDVPCYVAAADACMVTDPHDFYGSLFPGIAQQLHEYGDFASAPVLDLGNSVDLAGFHITATSAPGHSAGSTLFTVTLDDGTPACFTGDVLFAGAIGRTDLPSGSPQAMTATLSNVVKRLDPATLVLPGHGAASTIAAELTTNPYLA